MAQRSIESIISDIENLKEEYRAHRKENSVYDSLEKYHYTIRSIDEHLRDLSEAIYREQTRLTTIGDRNLQNKFAMKFNHHTQEAVFRALRRVDL